MRSDQTGETAAAGPDWRKRLLLIFSRTRRGRPAEPTRPAECEV
ncbi:MULTISPECIES: hypothetical protein [unclassified Kitasatospora]|nr:MULTISPECIES: hypothetical protein [unclassified Kitasatospora]